MSRNVCCPYLKVVRCGDTKEHKHLACDPKITLSELEKYQFSQMMDNDWVKVFCLMDFDKCKYFPRKG